MLRLSHPAHLASALTAEELLDWWLYYQHDPWGEEREDYRAWFATCRSMGGEQFQATWPYVDPGPTADELKEALGRD